jgi:hypothetical protein
MYDKSMIIFIIILFGLMSCCFLGDNGYNYKEGYTNSKTIAAAKAALSDRDNTQPDFKKVKEREQTEEEKNEEKRKFRYDNYNHFEKNSAESTETLFYNKKAGTARIVKTSKYGTIVTTDTLGASTTYSIISPASIGSQVYIGPNGSTATVVTIDGGKEIHTTSATGVIVIYKGDKPVDKNDFSKELNAYIPTTASSSYNGDTKRTKASDKTIKNANKHPNDFTSSSTSAKDYKEVLYNVDSNASTTGSNTQVPRGKEDLYILKSQIVPLNCPACPTYNNSSNNNSSNNNNNNNNGDTSSSSNNNGDTSSSSNNNGDTSSSSNNNSGTSSSSNKSIVGLGKDTLHDALKGSSMFAPMEGSYFGTSFGANMGAEYNGSSENEIEEEEDKKEGDRMPVPVLWNYTSFGM